MSETSGEEIRDSGARAKYYLLKTIVVSYLSICLLMMLLERFLVYHPPMASHDLAEIESLGGKEVSFRASDGKRIFGFFFPHDAPHRGLLYSYGNGEDAYRNAEYMAYLRDRLQASVLVFDYRGYGKSEGKPIETELIQDGVAAQQWLANQLDTQPKEIVLMGRSLGGGVAVALAEQQGAQALIIHSSFANMVDVGAAAYPWLPVRLLMKNRFESEKRIKNFAGPLLQFHGTDDEIVPLELARPLYEASSSAKKQFVEIPAGRHNDGLNRENLKALEDFLRSL